MIVVIADDLTGAAELGGIGLRYGLAVELAFEVKKETRADLLVISTDTRSRSEAEAVKLTSAICEEIKALQPQIIYKKVDSVLRGYVVPELKAQMDAFGQQTALLLPANPALGRTIKGGNYYVHGKPITETGFCEDPEFPTRSSQIIQMLPSDAIPVEVQEAGPVAGKTSIVVGETSDEADLKDWVSHLHEGLALAGGSGFFSALLENYLGKQAANSVETERLTGSKLFVCGTAFESCAYRVAALAHIPSLVHYIPEALLEKDVNDADISGFASEINIGLRQNASAILAVDPATRKEKDISALELRERTALIVKAIFEIAEVNELVIEGGSTASQVLIYLNVHTLVPEIEYAPGVIRSRVKDRSDLFVTLKPGSYNWPREVWMF